MNYLNQFVSIIVILFCCLIFPDNLTSQILPNRYVEPVFASVIEYPDVQFSSNVPQPKRGGGFYEFITGLPINVQEDNFDLVDLRMDIFEPAGDTMELRPLIIIAFGGGFVDNDRKDWAIRLLAQSLANYGFVTASIDYRLGMNMFNQDKAKRAVYRGLQDGRSAVRYFKNHVDTNNVLRIDTNNIFMGGHSSGGFIALHMAYLDKDAERPGPTRQVMIDGDILPDQGCMDCVGDNTSFRGDVKAIFNLAGAIGETSFIELPSDPPLITFHSTDDGTVPYYSGEPFSNISGLIIGSDLPIVYGSHPIVTKANDVQLPNEFHSYTNRGHDVHINGSVSLHNDIVPEISDWIYQGCLQPENQIIEGNQLFCLKDTIQQYQCIGGNPKYYEWEVSGGEIIIENIFSNQITIDWDPLSPEHIVSVTPYSNMGARGSVSSLNIIFESGKTVNWVGQDGKWEDNNNWDLNRSPLPCDTAIIQSISSTTITLDEGKEVFIESLTLNDNIILRLMFESMLGIRPYDKE